MDYFTQYIKYKSKYTRLKRNMNNEYNFYFVHMTKNFKNFKNIIKDGKIKLGCDIPVEDKFLCGDVDHPYIYFNINFNDLDNLDYFQDFSFIIKPEIINTQSIEFFGGWGLLKITEIHPEDSQSDKIKKINKIKKFVSNPYEYGLPENVLDFSKFMQHEVRFTNPIDLHKYLYGVVIPNYNKDELEKQIDKVKKLLKKYNLDNIKIFSNDKKILSN